MPRPKMKKIKDPYEDLPSDFKDSVASASDEEIRQKIAKITLDEMENQKAKDADLDLSQKQLDAAKLGAKYTETTKSNSKTLKGLRMKLDDVSYGSDEYKKLLDRIAQITLDEASNQSAKKLDLGLDVAKETAKAAAEGYAEVTKAHELQVRYCRDMLKARGRDVGAPEGEVH